MTGFKNCARPISRLSVIALLVIAFRVMPFEVMPGEVMPFEVKLLGAPLMRSYQGKGNLRGTFSTLHRFSPGGTAG